MSDRRWSTWFPALAERNIRLYITGQSVSVLGTWVLEITLNLLLWELSRAPALLGLLNFLLYGPTILIFPFAAGRLTAANARSLTMRVLLAGLALAVLLAVLTATGLLAVPALLAIALLRGVLNGIEIPARQMLLTTSIGHPDEMGSAVAMNTMVYQLARMAGPGVAAMSFGTLGPTWGFAGAAAALAFMWVCLRGVRTRGPAPAAAPQPGASGIRGAIAFLRGDRYGRLFLPSMTCLALFSTSYQTLVPVLADRVFGDTTHWTSVFFAAAGCGALVAAAVLATRVGEAVLSRLQVALPWAVAAAVLTQGFSAWPYLTAACFAVIGFGNTLLTAGTSSMLHRRVPPEARNGLIALLLMAFYGVVPLGQLLAGALAQRLGVQPAFQALGAMLLASLLLLFVPRWWQLGRLEWRAERI